MMACQQKHKLSQDQFTNLKRMPELFKVRRVGHIDDDDDDDDDDDGIFKLNLFFAKDYHPEENFGCRKRNQQEETVEPSWQTRERSKGGRVKRR